MAIIDATITSVDGSNVSTLSRSVTPNCPSGRKPLAANAPLIRCRRCSTRANASSASCQSTPAGASGRKSSGPSQSLRPCGRREVPPASGIEPGAKGAVRPEGNAGGEAQPGASASHVVREFATAAPIVIMGFLWMRRWTGHRTGRSQSAPGPGAAEDRHTDVASRDTPSGRNRHCPRPRS